jgi:hypothetical protein
MPDFCQRLNPWRVVRLLVIPIHHTNSPETALARSVYDFVGARIFSALLAYLPVTFGAYLTAQTMVQVLKQCGNDLTRENVMRQAANLKNFELGLLLPGIKINTSPTDYFPVEQMQMSQFNGEHGELFGSPIAGEIGTQ